MKKRISVLQLFYTFDVEVGGGGLTLFAIELAKNLDPEHFDIILCSLGYHSSELGRDRIADLNNQGFWAFEATKWRETNPYQSFYESFKYLNSKFKGNPVNIIHSHSEYTDITALLLKLSRRTTRIIRTVHYGFKFEWSTKPLRRQVLTNFLYPILFDSEIGINEQNTDRLNQRRIARLLRKNSIRIPNAISTDRFIDKNIDIPQKKQSLGLPRDAKVIGTVGRLADQKGYTYLIDAAAIVLQENPDVYFLIIGDGPLANEHQEQTRHLEIADRVIFTGGRKDVAEILPCMDIFVSSSLWEGLPTVILEAMACDLPVIATDIPGSNELIEHKFNGWLVPPYNSEKLASAILELLSAPLIVDQFMKNSRKIVTQYSIDDIVMEYDVLYKMLCS